MGSATSADCYCESAEWYKSRGSGGGWVSRCFPDELPGMPPDLDIEFLIELLPGTAPIAKRPYRMGVNELEELKK